MALNVLFCLRKMLTTANDLSRLVVNVIQGVNT